MCANWRECRLGFLAYLLVSWSAKQVQSIQIGCPLVAASFSTSVLYCLSDRHLRKTSQRNLQPQKVKQRQFLSVSCEYLHYQPVHVSKSSKVWLCMSLKYKVFFFLLRLQTIIKLYNSLLSLFAKVCNVLQLSVDCNFLLISLLPSGKPHKSAVHSFSSFHCYITNFCHFSL